MARTPVATPVSKQGRGGRTQPTRSARSTKPIIDILPSDEERRRGDSSSEDEGPPEDEYVNSDGNGSSDHGSDDERHSRGRREEGSEDELHDLIGGNTSGDSPAAQGGAETAGATVRKRTSASSEIGTASGKRRKSGDRRDVEREDEALSPMRSEGEDEIDEPVSTTRAKSKGKAKAGRKPRAAKKTATKQPASKFAPKYWSERALATGHSEQVETPSGLPTAVESNILGCLPPVGQALTAAARGSMLAAQATVEATVHVARVVTEMSAMFKSFGKTVWPEWESPPTPWVDAGYILSPAQLALLASKVELAKKAPRKPPPERVLLRTNNTTTESPATGAPELEAGAETDGAIEGTDHGQDTIGGVVPALEARENPSLDTPPRDNAVNTIPRRPSISPASASRPNQFTLGQAGPSNAPGTAVAAATSDEQNFNRPGKSRRGSAPFNPSPLRRSMTPYE